MEQEYISLPKVAKNTSQTFSSLFYVNIWEHFNSSFCSRWAPWHVHRGRAGESAEPCGPTATGEQRQTAHHVQGVDPVQVPQGSGSAAGDPGLRHRQNQHGLTFKHSETRRSHSGSAGCIVLVTKGKRVALRCLSCHHATTVLGYKSEKLTFCADEFSNLRKGWSSLDKCFSPARCSF